MAVSKELLARYKELKAQGVNISLAELKAQMEKENEGVNEGVNKINTSVSEPYTNETNKYNQYTQTNLTNINNTNEISEYNTPSHSNYTNSIEPEPQTTTSSDWNTTYYSSTPAQLTPESYSDSTPITPVAQQPYTGNLDNHPRLQDDYKPYAGNIQTIPTQNTDKSQTKKFALIGYPLGHSLSEYIHNAGFKSINEDATYEILETSPENLVDRIKYLKSNNYSGFNVTIPLKLPITMFLDSIDDSATIANAVNTVVIDPITKEMTGYNTDVLGFINAIPEDFTLSGKVAGILGTGGAARAAITALAQRNMKEIKLFTRNVPNSLELLNYLRKTFPSIEFNTYQIERIRNLSDIDLLVNATPIGMQGRAADYTPVEENELKTLPEHALVYDVIYNPKNTILLKLAKKLGYRTLNGIDMLIRQAVASQQIWTGKVPDFKDMKIAALENL
ncbi:shikimate dehydrogenase [bacterium]|nr:shikimate dehydrogenase [bacterium]